MAEIDVVSVHELLLQRAKEGSRIGQRSDNSHLALVIEGGGMRGVVSGGMVTGLEEEGLLDCFDSIHGSSAGACAGAYFAAGQANLGTRIYYEDINNKHFINLLRPLRGKPIMDAGFLIDHVMRFVKPLRVERFLKRPSFLNVVVTDIESGTPIVFDNFVSEDDFFHKLKASIYLPIIAGKSVSVDGRPMCDGGVVQQIAIDSAVAKNATHILALMTRKENELMRPVRLKGKSLEEKMMAFVYGVKLSHEYSIRNANVNEVVKKFRSQIFVDAASGRSIRTAYIARPQESVGIERLTTDGGTLRKAAEDASIATKMFLRPSSS